MRLDGMHGQGQNPPMGLRQGCPLSATLFGTFMVCTVTWNLLCPMPALHLPQHAYAPEGVGFADDICLLATWPEDLQALVKVLAACSGMLHMEIRAVKSKVMPLFVRGMPASRFTCNGISKQVGTFRYLGLHFYDSEDIAHLIDPIGNKAAGSWAAVQRRHSLLQCGSTTNIHLQLLQSILVPALLYGTEVWGMHSPGAGAAGQTRLALQQVYDLYLDRHQLPVWSSILILGGQPIATDRRAGVVRAIAGTAHYAVLGPWVMRGV